MGKVEKIGIAAVILLLMMAMLPIHIKAETQSIPEIEDPSPDYWETSEYLIGSVAVGIILPESNGTIDPNTENWTDEEIEKVLSEIQYALDWWASQNTNASVNFVVETHLMVPTSYEPISRNESEFLMLVVSEVMRYLGFDNILSSYQVRDYANALREKYKTDWAFAIFVVDSSNDPDGVFKGGGCARAAVGGTYLFMTYDNGKEYVGIENMDKVCAHEIGHIFWAADEYVGIVIYGGYLNVPSVPMSGCIMDRVDRQTWNLSGAPHGLNGTWGQVGWRDSDGDGIQDIVDTFQRVFLNPYERIGNKFNFSGVAAVTPYPNRNPSSNNPDAWHYDPQKGWIYIPINVTINKIQSVQYRIDSGEWLNATIEPTRVRKLVKYPDTYEYKETFAIVNFTFLTQELSPGNHTVELKATDQWGNSGYFNQTVTIPKFLRTDINKDGIVNIMDIAIVARAYGSKPGDPNWNPIADIAEPYGEINIIDIATVAKDYGKTA